MSKVSLRKHNSVVLVVPGRGEFVMTPREYDQLGQWIAARRQAQAVSWWQTNFGVTLETAVYCINQLQIAQQYGGSPAAARNLQPEATQAT